MHMQPWELLCSNCIMERFAMSRFTPIQLTVGQKWFNLFLFQIPLNAYEGPYSRSGDSLIANLWPLEKIAYILFPFILRIPDSHYFIYSTPSRRSLTCIHLWQQQPWHSWQPEAKDFLRLNIRVPVVNPRWMYAVCCVCQPQPWQALRAGSGSRVGAVVLRRCEGALSAQWVAVRGEHVVQCAWE